MPKSIEATKEATELSSLLDILNTGTLPESDDEELSELLAVAAFIKNAGTPVQPPQHIIDQTVDQVLATMPATTTSKKSSTWLYSGMLGAAASIMLIIGFNLIPTWTIQKPASVPALVTSIAENSPPESPGEKPSPLLPLMVPVEHTQQPNDTSPAIIAQQPSRNTQLSPAPPSPNPSSNNTMFREQPALSSVPLQNSLTEEKIARVAPPANSPHKYRSASPPTLEKSPFIPTPLSLPGLVPDSTVINKKDSTIRQVFYKGTTREIIITQHTLTNDNSGIIYPPTSKADTAGEKARKIHKITVTIFNQKVTLEGYQTEQELLTLANSLTPYDKNTKNP